MVSGSNWQEVGDILSMNTAEVGLPIAMLYGGYIAFIAAMWRLIQAGASLVDDPRKRSHKLEAAIYALAACLPLGLACSMWAIGPSIVRWHLADLGLVAAISLSARYNPNRSPYGLDSNFPPDHTGTGLPDNRRWFKYQAERYDSHRKPVRRLLIWACIYEASTWLLHQLPGMERFGWIGSFDWKDIISYTVGAVVTMECYGYLSYWAGIRYERLKSEVDAAEMARIQKRRSEPVRKRKRKR